MVGNIPSMGGSISADTRALLLFEANKKSVWVAYVMYLFLGWFGGHNFYLNHTGAALAQLLITVLSVPIIGILAAVIGPPALVLLIAPIGVFIWLFVEVFLILNWIRNRNNLSAMQLGA